MINRFKKFFSENYIANIVAGLSLGMVIITSIYRLFYFINKMAIYNYYNIDTKIMLLDSFKIEEFLFSIIPVFIFILIFMIYEYFDKYVNSKNLVKKIWWFFIKHILLIALTSIALLFIQSLRTNLIGLLIFSIIFEIYFTILIKINKNKMIKHEKRLEEIHELPRNEFVKNIIMLIAAVIAIPISLYFCDYFGAKGITNNSYYIDVDNSKKIIVDMNYDKAIICDFNNDTIDCDSYIKVIDVKDYSFYHKK